MSPEASFAYLVLLLLSAGLLALAALRWAWRLAHALEGDV